MDKFVQLRATVICQIDSLHEALHEHPFQHAAMTLALSLQMVTSQSCTEFSQIQMTASSMAIHLAHLASLALPTREEHPGSPCTTNEKANTPGCQGVNPDAEINRCEGSQ